MTKSTKEAVSGTHYYDNSKHVALFETIPIIKPDLEKKAAELARIAGEKVLNIDYYQSGIYMIQGSSEKAANKLFKHYNYCRVTKAFLNHWYVLAYENETIER